MAEEGKEETTRTGTVEGLGGRAKGVYGFSVRLGVEGKPVVERFGNIRETPSGAVVAETREPLVDVLDEGDHILVVAEMPGVDEKDIRVKVEGDVLEIVASGGQRRYHKEVLLPSPVDPGKVATSYRNGILEARLTKTKRAGA
jgi:HSP20 family protein